MLSRPAASKQRQEARDDARRRPVVQAEQGAEHREGRILPQPDDGQQDLVGRRQGEAAPATDGAAARGPG
jgi:hypothetical protein